MKCQYKVENLYDILLDAEGYEQSY